MEPDRWSICISSEENSSWAFVYYTHPSPAFLDRINASWKMKFEDCNVERVHRITSDQFFSNLANSTRSGMVGLGIVHELVELSKKGVTTTGMIEYMKEVRLDAEMVMDRLSDVRQAPYEPGKDVEAYP
jgi:preprotein translocase subunit Sec63